VNSKKAITRLHTQKAHMMEMEMALKHQLGAAPPLLGIKGVHDRATYFGAARELWHPTATQKEQAGIVAGSPNACAVDDSHMPTAAVRAAMVKVAGAISKSGEVMKSMNAIMKVGAMQQGMQAMAKEMMKAGLIEEMVDNVMEDVGGAEEEDVDEEVQKARSSLPLMHFPQLLHLFAAG
jgi:Snf7